jgi:hypothetical protein
VEYSTVRLRAVSGTPLTDAKVRDTVIATAQSLAERNGVELRDIAAADDAVTMTLGIDKIAAVGFLAELRRATNTWYAAKFKRGPLWGEGKSEE